MRRPLCKIVTRVRSRELTSLLNRLSILHSCRGAPFRICRVSSRTLRRRAPRLRAVLALAALARLQAGFRAGRYGQAFCGLCRARADSFFRETGAESQRLVDYQIATEHELAELGVPSMSAAGAPSAFDYFADYLAKGIMLDTYRKRTSCWKRWTL